MQQASRRVAGLVCVKCYIASNLCFPMPYPVLRRLFLLLFGLLLRWLPAHASHLVGGEVSYRYLDANGPQPTPFRYEITARVYLDAQTPLGSTGHITVSSKDPASGYAVLDDQTVPFNNATIVTPPLATNCSVQVPAVELRLYSVIANLPAVSQGYQAVYEASARTSGITNLSSSASQAMTLTVDMTPPTLPNSSPTFSSNAVDLICLGDTATILNNAVDADGDRLSYSFAVPSKELGVPVAYAQGYNYTQPFGSDGSVSINSATGLTRYVSQRQGRFLVAIDVLEYRTVNGREILLSVVRRDIQITVRACTLAANQAPQFSAATLARRDYVVGEGQTLAFDITATDPEGGALTLTVGSALLDGAGGIEASFAGGTGSSDGIRQIGMVSVPGVGTATGTFRLVAGCGVARAAPYDVLLSASDEACNRKTVVDVLRITVTGSTVPPTGIRGDSLLCNLAEANYSVVNPALSQYQWQVTGGELLGPATGPTVRVRWQAAGQKTVAARGVTALGCLMLPATKTVTVLPGPTIVGPRTFCRTASTGLRYSVSGAGAYRWTVSNGVIVSGQGTNAVVIDFSPDATATIEAENFLSGQCRVGALNVGTDNTCLYFYNIITPNNDHHNDTFTIENLARHPNTSLTVFNRWGSRVYESADYGNDFGQGAAPGMYYYLCRLVDGTVYKGWFEVVP